MRITFLSILILIFFTYLAHAGNDANNWKLANTRYLTANVGYSIIFNKVLNSHRSTNSYGSALIDFGYGLKLNKKFQTDLKLSYRNSYKYSSRSSDGILEHQKISSLAFMLSGYFFPKSFTKIDPYLMAGFGIAINKASNFTMEGEGMFLGAEKKSFAWQIGCGMLYKLATNTQINAMYKYVELGTTQTKGFYRKTGDAFFAHRALKGRLKTHEISVGMNYYF